MSTNQKWSRRSVLGAGLMAAGLSQVAKKHVSAADDASAELKGNIRHSIVHWCFKTYWEVAEMAKLARGLGCESIELIAPEHWPVLKQHGLTVAICSSHSFKTGFNNPKHWDMCSEKIKTQIDHCAAFGVKNVITFTGFADGMSLEDGANNCVQGLKRIIGYAEKKGVNICLEMLNTRDDTHPMKGHPGYQGDHTDYCIDIIKRVGSANMKLLFDVYHVQIMDGDVIRRIQQHHEYIGHVHTAGNPGRAELNDDQEINYSAVMKALVEVKYKGFIGHEFIPTGDPEAGLKEAIAWCDV